MKEIKMNRHERRKEAALKGRPINFDFRKTYKKVLNSEGQSLMRKIKNVNKHIRIAKATSGHEYYIHMKKAAKLIKRYEFN